LRREGEGAELERTEPNESVLVINQIQDTAAGWSAAGRSRRFDSAWLIFNTAILGIYILNTLKPWRALWMPALFWSPWFVRAIDQFSDGLFPSQIQW
jgi:hypothetical protein